MGETSTLDVQDITVEFGGVVACKSVTFNVEKGELLGLIGPNGAGKTSMLNVISGVYRPQRGAAVSFQDPSGEVCNLIGRRPHAIARLGIGRTLQHIPPFESMTVLDVTMLGRYAHHAGGFLRTALPSRRVTRDEVVHRRRAYEILESLDLDGLYAERLGELPYGVRKRVDLARALAIEPTLLLLDEPLGGLSGEEKEALATVIEDVHDRLGISVVLIEHDVGMVMRLADRIVVLDFGEVIATGKPNEVRRNAAVVDAYLGTKDSRATERGTEPGGVPA